MSWNRPTSGTPQGYTVLRGGQQLSSVGASTLSYTDDDGLAGSTSYTYTVRAYDSSGRTASASDAVTTPACSTGQTPSGSPATLLGSIGGLGRIRDVALDVATATVSVASEAGGTTFVDISNPASPRVRSRDSGLSLGVASRSGTAYVVESVAAGSGYDAQLSIFDLAGTGAPVRSSRFRLGTLGGRGDLHVDGSRLYVVAAADGMQVVDVTNRAAPVVLGAVSLSGVGQHVAASNSWAYVGTDRVFAVIDARDPRRPVVYSQSSNASIQTVNLAEGKLLRSDLLAVAIQSVAQPNAPIALGIYRGPHDDPTIAGRWLVAGTGGFDVVDISNPSAPVGVQRVRHSSDVKALAAEGSTLVAGGTDGTLMIFSLQR